MLILCTTRDVALIEREQINADLEDILAAVDALDDNNLIPPLYVP